MRKQVYTLISFITMLSILAGCGGSKSTEIIGAMNKTDPSKKVSEVIETKKEEIKGKTQFEDDVKFKDDTQIKDDGQIKDATQFMSTTKFAFDVFSRINEMDRDKNIFLSPLSISTALTMTLQGAGTTTKEGMIKTLKYDGMELELVNKSYKSLLATLGKDDKGIQLDINNSIWVRQGIKLKDEFINVNKDVFDANISVLDFSKPGAADKINSWVAESTKNKIKKMVEPNIPYDAALYIINAVYFKGEWTEKFNKELTFSKGFHSGDGERKEVMMMTKKSKIEYGARDDFRVVRLPYAEGKTSMYCVLPAENVLINDFIKGLDEGKWMDIKNSISKVDDVELNIPRLKMEYDVNNLKEVLALMGMKEAFGVNADFTGMSYGGLYINNVKHKAVVEVNEEGSEAAGVTEVKLQFTSLIENPPSFIADRPFLFFITENTTGTILFMGKMYNAEKY